MIIIHLLSFQISDDIKINDDFLRPQKNKCTHYLLFSPDLNWTTIVVGPQTVSKVSQKQGFHCIFEL